MMSVCAFAQNRVDIWTTADGLPQNSVTGLTQTLDGYLWLTTNDGLVRFDGKRFKVFNKSNAPEITTNRLVGAFGDKSGRLWFQTEDGGIVFYQNGNFTVVLKPNEISSLYRSPFFDDQKGGVIFYSLDTNYHFENGRLSPFRAQGIPEKSVIVLADREGGLWFSDKVGLYRLQNGVVKIYDLRKFNQGHMYQIAYEDRQGGIWLGYSDETNQPYQAKIPSQAKILRIKGERIQTFRFPARDVWHFAEDKKGDLWMTVFGKGIYRIGSEQVGLDDAITESIKPAAVLEGISPNSSGILVPDREGGMWVGTENGLARISQQIIRVYSKKDGLPEENAYPIYQDSAGDIWAGIWQNSLVKFRNGKFQTFLKTRDTFYISSLFEDHEGRFWVGNIDTLRYFDKSKSVDFKKQAGFTGDIQIFVISQDSDGNLWFGSDHGLSRVSNSQARIFTKNDGLPDDNIFAFLQAKNGKIWVGTRGGIALIEKEKISSFTVDDGLASNYIRSLYEDAEGVLWIGSYDGGLTRLKDGKFTHYTINDGLSSNGVFCILEDNHGWFWINSNQGIYRLARQELNDFADGKIKFLNSIAYGKQDGLLNFEGNGGRQPAGIIARDGKIWFPTASGLAVVDPENVIVNPLPPRVLIEEISIDRKTIDNDIYQAAIHDSSSAVKLNPDENNLEINYTGLSFINSNQIKFRYRMTGLEQDWNEVGTRRTAYYSYLPPGEYTFEVIAANRDGVWSEEGASVRIEVLPPFYRTWSFLFLCVFVFAALILIIFRYRIGQLKLRAVQQENFARQLIDSQELERGRIAAELHDGLGQSLVIIKNRAMMSLTRPNDLDRAIEQLNEIASASTGAIDEIKDIIYDLRPIQLDRLGLTGAIEEIAEKVAHAHELKLTKKIDDIDKIFPKESENSVYRIVQEGLNNIIKHSEATAFEVFITKKEAQIELIIKDDGKGFVSFETGDKKQKSGFGLVGMIERAKLLGGSAVIESAENKGATISVILPVQQKI